MTERQDHDRVGFKPLGEEIVHEGPVFRVAIGQVRTPAGDVLTREYVRHPGAVMVVPIVDGHVVMVRQYRAVIDQYLLEIPAGKRDVPGEEPATTAVRELKEEVGLAPGTLTELASFYNTPGFCDEFSYLFLATDCVDVGSDLQGAEEEDMTVEHVALDTVPGLIASGHLIDAKSIIGLLMARDALGGQGA